MKRIILLILMIMPVLAFAQLTDSARRLVHLRGAVNFRDVGGYPAADGKTVRWDKVYRSAAINMLTDEDMQLIAQKHIYTVIDFRGVKESAAAPDRLLTGADYILCPAGSDSLPSVERMAVLLKEKNFLETMYGKGSIQYFGDRYRPLFRKLLDLNDTAALLYHCTGGRDRTGMATALFLYTLGVPQDVIEADFTASNVYLESVNARMFAPLMKATGLSEEEIRKEMALRPQLLHSFFNAIKARYGSVEAFMEKELGVGKKETAILRRKFTA